MSGVEGNQCAGLFIWGERIKIHDVAYEYGQGHEDVWIMNVFGTDCVVSDEEWWRMNTGGTEPKCVV